MKKYSKKWMQTFVDGKLPDNDEEILTEVSKKGFEVPLLKWFRREMKSLIVDDLLSEKVIKDQGIFEYSEIDKLKRQLFSSNPGDVHARIWALVVFQWWWKKYMNR